MRDSENLWAFSRWRLLPTHPNTCHLSPQWKEHLMPVLHGSTWVLPAFTTGAPAANLRHPGGSRARGKAEAERRATVCHVDSVEFREGFPFALAEEKSSLFPPASRPASPTAQGTGLPSLLGPSHCDLQSSVKSAMQSRPGQVCCLPRACVTPGARPFPLPGQPSRPSQRYS